MDSLYRCNLSLQNDLQKLGKPAKTQQTNNRKVFQTLLGFLGIFHGKPQIIFDRIALVICGVNWSAQTRECFVG